MPERFDFSHSRSQNTFARLLQDAGKNLLSIKELTLDTTGWSFDNTINLPLEVRYLASVERLCFVTEHKDFANCFLSRVLDVASRLREIEITAPDLQSVCALSLNSPLLSVHTLNLREQLANPTQTIALPMLYQFMDRLPHLQNLLLDCTSLMINNAQLVEFMENTNQSNL